MEKQRLKLQQNVPIEKREKHKKYRLIEKEYAKRKNKYDEARIKATRARNEYLLCMDAANSSIQKYFVDDLSDLIDVSLVDLLNAGLTNLLKCQLCQNMKYKMLVIKITAIVFPS